MIYSNKKYNFSIRLPDKWKIEKNFLSFFSRRSVSFNNVDSGSIGISIFRLKKENLPDKKQLEQELLDSLNNTISERGHKNSVPYLVNRLLGGEINTAWGEFVYKDLDNESEIFGEVLAIRDGLKYVIIYLCDAVSNEEIKALLDSFKFERQTEATVENRTDRPQYSDGPQYSLVTDSSGNVRGFWLHDAKSWMKDAHRDGALKHVKLRMLVVKHSLSSYIYQDLMNDNYRVVPNSFDDKGGDFLMFGSAAAPGEKL
jgi:hypothetical protein